MIEQGLILHMIDVSEITGSNFIDGFTDQLAGRDTNKIFIGSIATQIAPFDILEKNRHGNAIHQRFTKAQLIV